MDIAAERITKWQQFSIEMIALLIFIYNGFLHQQERPNLFVYVFIIFISISLFLLLKHGLKEKFTGFHSIALVPIIFGIAYYLNYDIFVSIIISCVIVWRLAKHEIEPDLENEHVVIGLTLALVILAYVVGYLSEASERHDVFYLFMLQFIVLFVGKWISYHAYVQEKGQLFKKWLTSATVLLSIFSLTTLLYFLFPFVRNLFSTVLSWVSYGITYSFAWFFLLIERMTDNIEPAEGHIENVILEEREIDEYDPTITDEHLQIALIVIGLLVLLLLFFFFKKRFTIKKEMSDTPNVRYETVTTSLVKDRHLGMKRKKTKPPKDEVRKAFYQLESWTKKNNVGRWPFESIEEWLERYNMSHFVKGEAVYLYRHVRYGNLEVDQSEKEKYLAQIEALKNEFKHVLKEQKKE